MIRKLLTAIGQWVSGLLEYPEIDERDLEDFEAHSRSLNFTHLDPKDVEYDGLGRS